MFEGILKTVDGITSGERAYNDVLGIWDIDRWFTFPGMLRSCEYSVARMKEYGLTDAQVEKFPADGRTVFGYWQMPLAWDATSATLEVVEPSDLAGRLLADYKALPCGLTMWSPPTPREGVTAEVVAVPGGWNPKDFDGIDCKGKIVLTNLRGSVVRNEAIRRGAVGVLSDASRYPLEMPDAVDWMNAWSEDPQGWGLKAGERNLWGFNISHRRGQELRRMLARGKVVLRAKVDTRVYAGVMPAATGIVPGQGDEEVLVLGHGAEQGANDNASGCAVMLEALRALRVAIDQGKLPAPKRSIRMLISWEIYATQAFYAAHVPRFKKTVAGLCLDMVGELQPATDNFMTVHRNPHAMLSYTDAFSRALARKAWSKDHPRYCWNTGEFGMTDNITADPTIGVPTAYVGSGGGSDRCWHTSEDHPGKVSPANLKMMASYTATYLYFLASAGLNETPYLAELITQEAQNEIQERTASGVGAVLVATSADESAAAAAAAALRVGYLAEIHSGAFDMLARLVTPKERPALRKVLSSHRKGLTRTRDEAIDRLARTLAEAVASRGWKCPQTKTVEPTAEEREAAKMIVTRTAFGSLAFDTVPVSAREGLDTGRFGGPLYTVLTWCDGKRNLADAIRLAAGETGRELTGYVAQVKKLARLGMVKIEKA